MRKIYRLFFCVAIVLISKIGQAQVTTNGGMGLSLNYPDLATAIDDLNSLLPLTAPVVLNLNGAETAPIGGYVINNTGGTAVNTLIINGNGNTVTAGNLPANGSKTDAFFKIVGADYVTIQNFILQENSATANFTFGNDNRTEFGIALFLASATDGAQNNNILNNTITLASTYQNAVGIFSTSASDVNGGTLVATASSGTNSNNKFYGNTISNVAYGFLLIAPPLTATVTELGNEIGGTAPATGNTISFGTVTPADFGYNLFANVNPIIAGIYIRNGAGYTANYNNITSLNLSYASFTGELGGIIAANTAAMAASGVTYTNTTNSNTITLNNQAPFLTTAIDCYYGIGSGTLLASRNTIVINQSLSAAVTAANNVGLGGIRAAVTANAINFSNNNISINQTTSSGVNAGLVTGIYGGSAIGASTSVGSLTLAFDTINIRQSTTGGTYTGIINYIHAGGASNAINANYSGAVNINSNYLNTTGGTLRSTIGELRGIYHDFAVMGSLLINDNHINIDKTGSSITYGTLSTAQTVNVPNASSTITNNDIIFTGNASGSSAVVAIREQDGTGTAVKSINGNTININLPFGTGTMRGIVFSTGNPTVGANNAGNTGNINNNSILISAAGPTISGIEIPNDATTPSTVISNNDFNISTAALSGVNLASINIIPPAPAVVQHFSIFSNNFAALTAPNLAGGGGATISVISLNGGGANSTTDANVIRDNTIQNVTTAAATGNGIITGILVGGNASYTNIYKNKIFGLSTNASGGTTAVTGIRLIGLASSTFNVYNNLIGFDNSTAPKAISTNAVIGINMSSALANAVFNLFYNTIQLNTSSTGANFGSSGIVHTGNATPSPIAGLLNLRNNIIVNTSTANGTGVTVAFRKITASSLINYGTTSNNNLFYAGTPGPKNLIYYYDATIQDQTLPGYIIRVTPTRDVASVTENPPFLSTVGTDATFLHLGTVIGTLAESGAAPIATYTTDFDNGSRSATTPDIGADEFAGVCPPPTGLVTGFTITGAGPYTAGFTFASPPPNGGYMIVSTLNPTLPSSPPSGLLVAGNTFNGGTALVHYVGAGGTSFLFPASPAPLGTNYWVYSYNLCSGSRIYSTGATYFSYTPCVVPPTSVGAPTLTAVSSTSISGNFSTVAGANGYLVVMVAPPAVITNPANTSSYTVGQAIGAGTVVSVGSSTSFVVTGLLPNKSYTFYVFPYVSACTGQPVYRTASPGNATISTLPCFVPNTYSVGPTGQYKSIGEVITTLQSCAPLTGNFVFEFQPTYVSTVETFPLVLPAINKSGGSPYTVTFQPSSTVTAGISITSANSQGTLLIQGSTVANFNDNYIIDGRAGGTGSGPILLTIQNTFVGTAYAVQLENDASSNIIRYCNIVSRNAATSGGGGTISLLGTTGATGNDNNTIDHNNIYSTTSTPATVAIYSNGNATNQNNNNTISNNNIYDYFNATYNTTGIYLAGGSSNWNITGNSFYQTVTRNFTTANSVFSAITSGNTNNEGNNISGNFIGGAAALAASGTLTITGNGILKGIALTSSTSGAATTVQGNTISRINYTSSNGSSAHSLIHLIAGKYTVGNLATPNILGSATATGSISVSLSDNTTGVNFAGILGNSSTVGDLVTIAYNQIGGITVGGTSTIASTQGISIGGSAGVYTVNNNTIGSTTTANSFSHGLNTTFQGILGASSLTTTAQAITANTISNLTTTNTGTSSYMNGISIQGTGLYNVTGNTIHVLTSACTNVSNYTSSGITCAATTAGQIISLNTIDQVNSSAPGADIGVIGIYYNGPTTGTNRIERNLIYSLNAVSSVTASYITGIQLQGGTGLLQNNMIRLGNGVATAYTIFGILDNGGTTDIFHNSVYIDGTGVTAGSNSYGLYSVNTANRNVRNNIFWNARSNASASTPNHYAIRLGSLSGLNATRLNYNDYVVSGTGRILGYYGTDIIGFAAWKTATGFDANSYSAYPGFINPTAAVPNLHINASALTVVEAGGIDVGVTNDFDGDTRPVVVTKPDLGADEAPISTTPTKVDIGVVALTTPATGFACFTANETVTVKVVNFSTSPINLAALPNSTVTVNVTGAATVTLSGTIPAVTLASLDTVIVTMSATLNMTTPGLYNFSAFPVVGGGYADRDITNDIFLASRTVSTLAIGTASSSPASFCGAFGKPTLSLNTVSGGVIRWYEATVIGGPYTNVASSLTYTPASNITQTMYYYATVTCGATVLTSNTVTVTSSAPTVSDTASVARCGAGSVTLNATATGGTLKWYLSPSGGTAVGTGSPFVTPSLTQTTTYYATSESVTTSPAVATFGTGTNVNTTTGYPSPYTNWYGGTKHQMMIKASELAAAGITAGDITSVSFQIAAVGTTFTGTLNSFQINMGMTNSTEMNFSSFESVPSLVYGPVNQAIPTSGPTTVTHTFTTAFPWDGVRNIVIQTSYSNNNTGDFEDYVQVYNSATSYRSTSYARRDGVAPATILGITTPWDALTRRPNMSLGYQAVCAPPRYPVVVTINPQPTPISAAATPSTAIACQNPVMLIATGGTVQQTGIFTQTSGTVSLAIPDASSTGASSSIPVSLPPGAIIDSVIVTPNILMTFDADIIANLQAPNGKVINLFHDQGSSNDNFFDTRITSDVSAPAVSSGTAPFTGTFRPDLGTSFAISTVPAVTTGPPATFSDLFASPNGNWILRVYDDDAIITGTLRDWSIKIAYKIPVTAAITWSPVTGLYTSPGATPGTEYTGSGSEDTLYAKPTANTTYTVTSAAGSCTATNTINVTAYTISKAPDTTLINGLPITTACAGSNVTLTQIGGVLGTGAHWQWYIGTPTANFGTMVGTTTTVPNASMVVVLPTGVTNYYLRAEGGTSPCTAQIPNVPAGSPAAIATSIAGGIWLGNTADWSLASNWCGGVPTSASVVTIPVTANNPVIPAAYTGSANAITIAIGATVTIDSAGILELSGALNNNGDFNNFGELRLTGSGPQTFPGTTGNIGPMNSLTINNTSLANPAVTINRDLSIREALTPTRGIINLNNINITIRSAASGTARVGVVGTSASFTYTGTGRFIVERYFPSRRAWRLMTSPLTVDNSESIYSAWQNSGTYIAGRGTYVTGAGGVWPGAGSGLDASPLNNVSLRTFRSSAYTDIVHTINTKVSGTAGAAGIADNIGYFMFVRGDRTYANFNTLNSNITTLSAKGKIQTGNQKINLTGPIPAPVPPFSFGFVYDLVGNPYASPIDLYPVVNSSIGLSNTFIYLYDPNINEVGAWLTLRDSAGMYIPTLFSPSGYTGNIQSGQGFVVTRISASAEVRFAENNKTINNNLVFRPASHQTLFKASLYAAPSAGSNGKFADGIMTIFDNSYSADLDMKDALKFININENLGLSRSGMTLSVETRPLIVETDTLFLKLTKTTRRKYRFEFVADGLAAPNLAGYLEDKFLNTTTPVNLEGSTVVDFEVNTQAASAASDRFQIVFKPVAKYLAVTAALQQADIAVKWQIAEESTLDHYEVERSVTGTDFTLVNTQLPSGNGTTTGVGYNWLDVAPEPGDYYYRIRSVNRQGSVAYSQVVKVTVPKIGKGIFVYPNPVTTNVVGLQFNKMPSGVYLIRLLNSLGQVITSERLSYGGGTNARSVYPTQALAPGTYNLEITGPDKALTTIKVVVTKQQ